MTTKLSLILYTYLFFSTMDDIQSYTDKLRKTYRQSLGELIYAPSNAMRTYDQFTSQSWYGTHINNHINFLY